MGSDPHLPQLRPGRPSSQTFPLGQRAVWPDRPPQSRKPSRIAPDARPAGNPSSDTAPAPLAQTSLLTDHTSHRLGLDQSHPLARKSGPGARFALSLSCELWRRSSSARSQKTVTEGH